MKACFVAFLPLITFLLAPVSFCEPLEAIVYKAQKEQPENHRPKYWENKIIYSGTHGVMPITVEISCKPFDQNAHILLPVSAAGGSWSCDGVMIRGADGLPPQGKWGQS